MIWLRSLQVTISASLYLSVSSVAQACSDPTEAWYSDASDVVFDGLARCEPEKRTCRISVSSIVKNPLNLAIEQHPFDVDFQNWYADFYDQNSDVIVLACGVPFFEPEQDRFRARFYANLDEKTSELIVRTYRLRGEYGSLRE